MKLLKKSVGTVLALAVLFSAASGFTEPGFEEVNSLVFEEVEEIEAFELPLEGENPDQESEEIILPLTEAEEGETIAPLPKEEDVPELSGESTAQENGAEGASSDVPPAEGATCGNSEAVGMPDDEAPLEGDAAEGAEDSAESETVGNEDDEEGEGTSEAPEPVQVPVSPILRLTFASLRIGQGEKYRLECEYVPEEGEEEAPLTFASSNKKVVSVSADGVIKGVKRGSATITVRGGSQTATCAVKVLRPPKSVKLNAGSATLGYDGVQSAGTSFQLKVSLPSGSGSVIYYSGYDPSVVSVDRHGLVTACGTGKTTVTARTFNGKKARIALTVLPGPGEVHIRPEALTIGKGDTYRLSASIPDGTFSTIAYESDHSECVAVHAGTGQITAVSEGQASVLARTFNGIAASCLVTVTGAPNGLILSASTRQMGLGEHYTLLATPTLDGQPLSGTVKYTTSNKRVAEVDAAGHIRAKKKGSATITAVTCSGVRATCKVKVVSAPRKISLNRTSAILGYDGALQLGESFVLSAKLTGGASAIQYTGYDPGVVSVDGNGLVTAVGIGTTKITARTFNKKKAVCAVTVQPAPESLSFASEGLRIAVGQRSALKALLPQGTASSISYRVAAEEVASVGGNVVTGLAAGDTELEAATFNGATARCALTVLPAPVSMEVTPGSASVGLGEKDVRLNVRFDIGDLENACTFKSSNARIVKVSANGTLTPVKKGKANVTVTSYNGIKRTVKVTVVAAPKSVSLTPKQLMLEPGESAALKAVCPKGQSSAFSYSCSDESIAAVSADGQVQALVPGDAVVTVRTFNGRTASCSVRVIEPAAEIRMADSIALVSTLYQDFPIEIFDAQGAPYQGRPSVTFDPEDLGFYRDGKVVGRRPGSGLMIVRASGVERCCEVEVTGYGSLYPALSIAHRGASGYCPENTLEAFQSAAAYGADGIELDVRTTKDGVQVVHHDASFTIQKKKYRLIDYTYAQLKKLKPSICTLDEALEVIAPTGLQLHLEMKNSADGRKCVQIVRAHGMEDRTVYFSFYDLQLRQVYEAEPTAFLGKSINSPPTIGEAQAMVRNLHLGFFVSYMGTTRQSDIEDWHSMGLKVCIWTVNNKSDVRRFCELGTDYILSNYPDYCAEVR